MEYGCWKKIEKGVVALSIRATKCFVFYNFELSHIATIQKYWFQTFKIFLNFKASYNQTFTYIKKVYFCHMPQAKNSTKGKLGKISFQNKHYIHLAIQVYIYIYIYLIGIHSMQGWTATTRHWVTREKAQKRLQATENLFRKSLQSKDVS